MTQQVDSKVTTVLTIKTLHNWLVTSLTSPNIHLLQL